MGWTFFPDASRKDIIVHIRTQLVQSGYAVKRSCAKGNAFWALIERHGTHKICHARLKGGTRKLPGWGYKGLSHQDSHTCPVDYLRHLPPPIDGFEQLWREQVIGRHETSQAIQKTQKALKPGRVLAYGKLMLRLDRPLKGDGMRSGWLVTSLADSLSYRMSAAQIRTALEIELEQD